MKRYKNKEWLYHEYVILEKSLNQIGKECGIAGAGILYWMKKYNISRRTRSESKMGKKNPFFGKTHTEVAKNQNRVAHTGKIRSEESKAKQGKSNTGKKNPMYGRVHTDEVRIKQSMAAIGRILSKETKTKIIEWWTPKRRFERSIKMSGLMMGENNHNWRGGISSESYGSEFNDELRDQIRNRDNYICQECGIMQEDLEYNLDVHHIDYDKTNNRPENLISLCRSCHMKTNYNREDWIKYFEKF